MHSAPERGRLATWPSSTRPNRSAFLKLVGLHDSRSGCAVEPRSRRPAVNNRAGLVAVVPHGSFRQSLVSGNIDAGEKKAHLPLSNALRAGPKTGLWVANNGVADFAHKRGGSWQHHEQRWWRTFGFPRRCGRVSSPSCPGSVDPARGDDHRCPSVRFSTASSMSCGPVASGRPLRPSSVREAA